MRTLATVSLAVACLAACRGGSPEIFGEPVGIRIESTGRKLAVSAAVREGEDIRPHIEGLAGALAQAAAGCLVSGEAAIRFEVVAGTIRVPGSFESGVERCLAGALQGRAIGSPAMPPLHVRLRLVPE